MRVNSRRDWKKKRYVFHDASVCNGSGRGGNVGR